MDENKLMERAAAPDPRGMCRDMGPASCGKDGKCDGFGGCERYAANTVCIMPTCAGAVRRNLPGVCDGLGTCKPPGVASCSPSCSISIQLP